MKKELRILFAFLVIFLIAYFNPLAFGGGQCEDGCIRRADGNHSHDRRNGVRCHLPGQSVDPHDEHAGCRVDRYRASGG